MIQKCTNHIKSLENLPKFPETAFAAWLLQRMLGTLSACVPRNPSDESGMQIRIFIFHEETMPVSCLALQHTPTLSLEDSLVKPTKSWKVFVSGLLRLHRPPFRGQHFGPAEKTLVKGQLPGWVC